LLTADVREDKDSVYVRFEAPGLNKQDFDIQVNDRTLTIHGTKQAESEVQTGQYHLSECAFGEFERQIPLPCTVMENQAKARYSKGILHITFPKRGQSETHKIKIDE
jgi:HSP20 family protein